MRPWLRTEQAQRPNRNAILATVGVRAGVHHNSIQKPVTQLLLEPMKVLHMLRANRVAQLRFQRHDLPSLTNND